MSKQVIGLQSHGAYRNRRIQRSVGRRYRPARRGGQVLSGLSGRNCYIILTFETMNLVYILGVDLERGTQIPMGLANHRLSAAR